MKNTPFLLQRLGDRRSRRVVFLAHCLLNENTRYLGGACRGGCVREIVEQCIAADAGMVQMPCPEQHSWGGVLKRRLLALYGSQGTWLYRARGIVMPILLWYTRRIYRRLARRVAAEIQDYQAVGFEVRGVVGVDGSPACGVDRTLDPAGSFMRLARLDPRSLTVARMNTVVRLGQTAGSGLYVAALRRELARRGIDVPWLAHDLLGELEGRRSNVQLL